MSEAKFDWFVYIDEKCRYATPYGFRLENMTEEEAYESVQKHLDDGGLSDEGALRHTAMEYFDEGEEVIRENLITLFRVTKEVDVPVLPALKRLDEECKRLKEEERLRKEKRNAQRERSEYLRLKRKFGDV